MEKLFNTDNYVYFALMTPIEGSWGFTSYTGADGNYVRAIQGQNINGTFKSYDVFWSAQERVRRVPKGKKITVIKDGEQVMMLEVDYIRNSPNCEGSKNNAIGHSIIFKEIDEAKDAGLLLSRRKRKNDALTASFGLEGKELDDVAAALGIFQEDPLIKQNRVSEYAGQDPEGFFKHYENPNRRIKALILKGLHIGKLTKTGDAIFWGKEALGGNEDQAISYLISNPEKLQGLEESIGVVQTTPTKKKK